MKNKIFLILMSLTILVSYLTRETLNIEGLLFNSLSERFTKNQIDYIFDFNQKWEWLGYVLLPLVLTIKITLISCALWMGAFFIDKDISFKKLFRIVTKAEFIFTLVGLIKLAWFAFRTEYTLQDVQSFYPLSALSIVGNEGLSPWFVYPFQTLNLFELVYWITLAWLLGKELKSTTDKALKIVASSYGSGLVIWVATVMFLTLSMS